MQIKEAYDRYRVEHSVPELKIEINREWFHKCYFWMTSFSLSVCLIQPVDNNYTVEYLFNGSINHKLLFIILIIGNFHFSLVHINNFLTEKSHKLDKEKDYKVYLNYYFGNKFWEKFVNLPLDYKSFNLDNLNSLNGNLARHRIFYRVLPNELNSNDIKILEVAGFEIIHDSNYHNIELFFEVTEKDIKDAKQNCSKVHWLNFPNAIIYGSPLIYAIFTTCILISKIVQLKIIY